MSLTEHLQTLPVNLAEAINDTFFSVRDHYVKDEWDDAQVDAGRFCEAALRYLEWKMTGKFTPIDGKSKPGRKTTVHAAMNNTSLSPSLRAQVPQIIELVMDFRNNRNNAHLGNIDANRMDASCVVQNISWVTGEIVRLETSRPASEVQGLLDQLAERHVPLVQVVDDRPVLLKPSMSADEKVLVLLYHHSEPVAVSTLRIWANYGNATRWRNSVLKGLQKRAYIHIEKDKITLLRPGEVEAQRIISAS